MELIVHSLNLELKRPFRISHEVRTHQPSLIAELRDGEGRSGFGEAAMTRYYGLEAERCKRELEGTRFLFAREAMLTPEALHENLDWYLPEFHPFLRCALDVAVHDLWAKRHGKRLGEMWEQPQRQTPTCYTIGMADSFEELTQTIRANPWPIYKLKVGKYADDMAAIRHVRSLTDAALYVDANTGWTAEQTLNRLPELHDLGVQLLEQPLPVGARLPSPAAGHPRPRKNGKTVPLIADESCQTEADVEACAEHFDGINIKIVKCGGLLPARRMIARARQLGLLVMAGCMTESSFGISAIAQLLPELDFADMDGAMLLANDPALGVSFDPATGLARYPNKAGTGAGWRV